MVLPLGSRISTREACSDSSEVGSVDTKPCADMVFQSATENPVVV